MLTNIAFASAALLTAAQSEPADLTCETKTAVIYFESGSNALTPFAEAAVADVAERSQGCRVEHISLGVPTVDMADNAARERTVLIALNEAGLVASPGEVTTDFIAMDSARERATPAARRIGVEVTLAPRAIG